MGDHASNLPLVMRKYFLLLICVLLPAMAQAATDIDGMRIWTAPDHTRLVFDISAQVEHKLFRLHDPERLVIDFKQSRMKTPPDSAKFHNRHIEDLRYSAQKGGDFRVVLDLKQAVRPKSFQLKPNAEYGHRLVLDLYDQVGRATDEPRVVKQAQERG